MADIKKLLQSLNMSEDDARALVNQQDNPSVFTRMEQENEPISNKFSRISEYLNASQRIPESPYNTQNIVGSMSGSINTKLTSPIIQKLLTEEANIMRPANQSMYPGKFYPNYKLLQNNENVGRILGKTPEGDLIVEHGTMGNQTKTISKDNLHQYEATPIDWDEILGKDWENLKPKRQK